MKETLCVISLGCAKNLVNSEHMLALLEQQGYKITENPEEADAIIINTCGFINSAKEESIDSILDAVQLKKKGKIKKLVVCGCLSERYREEVIKEISEIDAIFGVNDYGNICGFIDQIFSEKNIACFSNFNKSECYVPREITTGPCWAYLKIAEGCNNFCSFCSIPYIQGRYRSKPIEDILSEAHYLASLGNKELILIAQDTSQYGVDLYGKPRLSELLQRLSEIDGIQWIRLHYLYPESIDDSIIYQIANNNKIVKYVDMPIQHINDKILKLMNRHTSASKIKALLLKLRECVSGIVIRTSLITGFPGEGEAEFEELCDFLKEYRLERVGVFPYSPEEGTASYRLGHVPFAVAERRATLITELQAVISDNFNKSLIGRSIPILCEGFDSQLGMHFGRSYMDSPDVDNHVYFTGIATDGEIANMLITGSEDGNLLGEIEHEYNSK